MLTGFQKEQNSLEHVELQLSYLHNANYKPRHKESTLIIFLSNAVDDNYTNKKQFEDLLENMRQSLTENQSAVFIHHSAGRQQFGLYNFKKTSAGYSLTTICRDNFLTAPVVKVQKYYKTHFDNAALTQGKIPACHQMLADYQQKENMKQADKNKISNIKRK